MRTALQVFTSLVALGGLLGSAATHATDIAELPLKASVLAKPNVIWGMDDSGSMDWEIQINTTSGVAYWDGTQAWSGGKPLSTSSVNPLQYLFPLGTAAGAGLYSTTSGNGRAAPPIPQFAWTRSSRYNPIYYNSNATYKPWSKAYLNGAVQPTYPDASITAAPAHPAVAGAPTMDLTADWTTGSSGFSTIGARSFRVIGGMVLPEGALVESTSGTSAPCNGTGTNALSATQTKTVAAGTQCRANVPFYPATFWHPTVCASGDTTCVAAPDCTIDGTTCVAAPDGSSAKLRRYEIRSTVGTYPSGRTYAQEIQNFANWFTYHRKRKLMLAGSMSNVLENITGLRMGVVPFNANTTITMEDVDSTDVTKNRLAVAGRFYLNALVSDDTPTLTTLKHIGTQIDSDTNLIKYACQKNSAFIVTDGFANDFPQSTPGYNAATYGSGAPYTTTTSGSLADLALAFYTNRARASGGSALTAGLVPISFSTAASADLNPDLHLNTYAIVLGQQGSVWAPGIDAWATPPTWPAPVNDSITMIDDLWHATVNGRGKMYLATSPAETSASIQAGLNDILNDSNSQSSVAVSTVNLQAGDGFAYLASYNAAGWTGNVTANPINAATAVISDTPTWDGGALLARDYTTRVIASQNSTGGVAFTEAAVGSLINPSSAWGATSDLMAYLRGARTLEGTAFRTRTSLMGAVINAEPVVSRETAEAVVYVASGEGMLHAFNATPGADAGKELWAFVPRAVLADLGQTTARSYSFKTQLDGTPTIGKVGTGAKLLVAGLGAAGNSYYALDVSTPLTNTEANAASWVKWDFPGTSTSAYASKVGQTVGRPVIVRAAAGYRVLVTSGYNSTLDGKGRLFVLDPADGSVLKEFVTPDGSLSAESGLANVTPYAEDDGSVRYVYGGDLLGNLWRFDLEAATLSAPNKVAVLKDSTGKTQPVTAAPELTAVGSQRVVLVGTGRLLDVTDWGTTSAKPGNTFYAIADGATIDPARSSLVQKTYTRATDSVAGTAVNWTTQRGWYMDLPSTEHANTRPVIAFGGISFVTNISGSNDCSAVSYLYVLDINTGGKSSNVSYVSTPLWTTSNSTGVTAVKTTTGDVKGMVRSYDGERKTPNLANNVTINPSKNAWREVRQQ